MNNRILLIVKIVVFILMSWFIADQLFLKNNFKAEFNFFIAHLQAGRFYLFFIALLLMPLNWILETAKWKMLLKSKTSFSKLLKSVIAGVTAGFITPGRSGEFAGRVLFLDEDNKAKAFYLSIIGGIAQNAATLITGVFLVRLWRDNTFLTGAITGLAVAYLLAYFRFDLLNKYLLSNSFFQKYGLVIHHADLPDVASQTKVLFISWVRLMVYLSQYVLLWMCFGVSSDWFLLSLHGAVFLVAQTFSPLMPLLDVSYRGGSALYVFKGFSDNNIAILSAVLMVWLMNLVIPAITGYLFILRKKVV